MKSLVLLVLAPGLFFGGSDYTVDTVGVTSTVPFADNGHINVRTLSGNTYNVHFEAKCITRTDAECAGKRHEVAQYIGQTAIPWNVIGVPESDCVSWVQLSQSNEHYGQSGQPPVCLTITEPEEPCPTPSTPTTSPMPHSTEPMSPGSLPTPTPTWDPTPTPSTSEPSSDSGTPLPEPSNPTHLSSSTPTSATPTTGTESATTPAHTQSPTPPGMSSGNPSPTKNTLTAEPKQTFLQSELAVTGATLKLLYLILMFIMLGCLLGWVGTRRK